MYTIMDGQEEVTIDPDGSGPIDPFSVICNGKSEYATDILCCFQLNVLGKFNENNYNY